MGVEFIARVTCDKCKVATAELPVEAEIDRGRRSYGCDCSASLAVDISGKCRWNECPPGIFTCPKCGWGDDNG